MTEIQLPYLPSAQFFKILCRLGINEQDVIGDSDGNPQIRTIGGTVSISSSIPRFRYTEADGRKRVVYTKTETYNIQTSTGELFDADGNIGVNLLNTNSPQMDPQGWTYRATVRPNGGQPFDVFIPSDPEGDVFDLGDGLVFTPSTGITSLETRVKALEDAAGSIPLPGGGGSSAVTATNTPSAPAEGSSASYLVTSAVSWPVGLVWSTDPDGGVAPTIAGSALVSLFTVGGVTRAIVGATFPGVSVPDTTAPAWSATLTTGTPAATSVVVAASALATDAAGVAGYEYSLNSGGSWTAIAPSGLNFTLTGLTAGTAYPAPRFRAKDAANNVSAVLTAQAFTTASGGDVTNPTPGTLASSAITSSGFTLTVSGASDAGGLHATPYAYSTDNGSTWSAWQAGATYNATGLAASTSYQARHKVRDAAGNEATGTAVTVTTSSAAITLVSDDFNRADSSTGLGTATTGQTWVNSQGIIGIVSNEAKKISGTGLVSLIEVGQRDMYVSVLTVGDTNGGHGLYARYTDADNYYTIDTGSNGLGPKLIARMGGVDVNVRIQRTLVMGDRYGIRVKDRTGGGAVVELLINNVVVDTWDHADSTIVGTKAGIKLNTGYANLRYDNFTVTSA